MNSPSRIAIRPTKGLRMAVVKPHVAEDLAHQVEDRAEDTPTDAGPADHAEPDFHLVQPGGIGGREMKLHVWMTLPPRLDRRRLVHREVIQNQVNLFPPLAPHRLVEEADELFPGVMRHAATLNFAGANLQGGQQGDRPAPGILDAVTFRLPRAQRQGRLGAIQGLDGRLLIHTEDHRLLRRVQVQPQDIFGLGFKVRIGAGHVAPQAVRLQPGLVPHPHHRHMADPTRRAKRRLDQWGIGLTGERWVTARIMASFSVVSFFGRPGRAASSRPSNPACWMRCFQCTTRRRLIPVSASTRRTERPSASNSSTRARRTPPAGERVERITACKASRS